MAVQDPATFQDFEGIFANILRIAIRLAGLAVFVMLLIGGFKFLTSGGNPEAKAKASQTITWAIIGFVVLILAWFILRFIAEFTGLTGRGAVIDILKFEIPGFAP